MIPHLLIDIRSAPRDIESGSDPDRGSIQVPGSGFRDMTDAVDFLVVLIVLRVVVGPEAEPTSALMAFETT